MHAILSIHDVMPSTLNEVQGIIDILPSHAIKQTTLLVVPGLDWSAQQIAQLKQWQDQGMELAGHGWFHQCRQIKGIKHKLHSVFISRNAAEHLALSRQELINLLQNNYQWFMSNGLNPPKLYVPPAWAMGALTKADLADGPFEYYEDTSGIYSAKLDNYKCLPLVGFEADTPIRAFVLYIWNRINAIFSTSKRPLRVSIHPFDLKYKLAKEIFRIFRLDYTFVMYRFSD